MIRIVSHVGWDELLRYRSRVFVMEEEYRIHRALLEEIEKQNAAELENDYPTETISETEIEKLSLEDRGRSDVRKSNESFRTNSSSSPKKKGSVDVNKLLTNLPQKSERSKSNDKKAPVTTG